MFKKLLRLISMLMIAAMLGISNIINEEVRMVQDSFDKIEFFEEEGNESPF